MIEERGIVSPHFVHRQTRVSRDLGERDGTRRPHRMNLHLRSRRGNRGDVDRVSEDHLRVEIGAWSVGLVDIAVPIQGDPSQVEGKARTEEIPVAYLASPESRAVDQRPADIGPAAVVFRQRRDERPVLRGEHREIRRAISKIR